MTASRLVFPSIPTHVGPTGIDMSFPLPEMLTLRWDAQSRKQFEQCLKTNSSTQ